MAIILASQSPRRRELLAQVGLKQFIIRPALGEEKADPSLLPAQLVEELSRCKAREVAGRSDPGDLIIAADTVVAVEDRVLGKPRSREEAREVTLCRGGQMRTGHEATAVRFRSLSPEEIDAYLSSGEPMDKAGAYGIQGLGALLVEGIRGDYSNVVGLPLCRLGQMLKELGVDLLGAPVQKEQET